MVPRVPGPRVFWEIFKMAVPPHAMATEAAVVETITIDYDKLAAAILRQQKLQQNIEPEAVESSEVETEEPEHEIVFKEEEHTLDETEITANQVVDSASDSKDKKGRILEDYVENATRRTRIDHAYFKQVKKRIKLWHQRTHAKACLVYLQGKCVKIEGPQHIKNALENDTSFNQAFLQAATSNDSPNHIDHISSFKIPLDYHKMTVSKLREVLTKIVTTDNDGERVQPRWGDNSKKPSWWPAEMPYISPHHHKAGNFQLRKPELQKIVGHYVEYQKQNEMKETNESVGNALGYNLVEVLGTGISISLPS